MDFVSVYLSRQVTTHSVGHSPIHSAQFHCTGHLQLRRSTMLLQTLIVCL